MTRLLAFAALLVALPAGAQETLLIEDVATHSAGMGRTDGPFTLVSLRDGALVVAPEATVRADSASAAWDLGIRGTEVILNGGASGPGGLRGALVAEPFDAVTALPDTLMADGEGECPRGAARVVCHGSGNGWYTYAGNGVEPVAGRTLVVVRPDGSAAKVRFVRYVLGEEVGGVRPRFVTLEVVPLGAGS
ncbi:HmuY family protein [Rubrivirga sp.]|uniref:HmuY family protein n=1 Tax=Rubrivirga sp. TaxID=1885344 RepID=UPI003B51E037